METITKTTSQESEIQAAEINNQRVFKAGSLASWVLLAYSLATMVIVIALGTAPETARATFDMLRSDRLVGLLRLDILTVFCMPLYLVLFFSVYLALKKSSGAQAALLTLLVMAGLTLFLATPSVFSWISLSDRFAAATDPVQKNLLLAAGEAILASDMWHGSGPIIGGLLQQIGATLISVTMLRSKVFSKWTGWVGVVTHGFDLLHILGGFFTPVLSIAGMAVAGPLYLVWFPLVAIDLVKLGQGKSPSPFYPSKGAS